MKLQREVLLLCLLFGSLYFVQGIAEPTEGLVAQPLRAQLRHLKVPNDEITNYSFFIGLPWSFKLLFGLLSDFVPLWRSRRKSYLVLSTLLSSVCMLIVAGIPFELKHLSSIAWLIFAASVGVAFTDVVVDALAVAAGQKYELTGRFQAIQWGAMYTAAILTGSIGGWLSQFQLSWIGFLICGILAGVSLVMTVLAVKEPPQEQCQDVRPLDSLWLTLKSPMVWTTGGFLFLWNFNPFSSVVQEDYMTKELLLSEQLIGHARSVFGVGSILACAAYAVCGPRIPIRWLIHGSILVGVLSSLVYLVMWDAASALVVSLVSGVFYMTGTLVQLDLAARTCKSESAGTTFAALMAISNIGVLLGIQLGGNWYDWLAGQLHSVSAAYPGLFIAAGIPGVSCWESGWIVARIAMRAECPLTPSGVGGEKVGLRGG